MESLDGIFCCKEHGNEWVFAGTGTALHPDCTPDDYLRGLFACNPPTLHLNFYTCPDGCRKQAPLEDDVKQIFANWKLR